MNTPAHIVFSLALLGRRRAWLYCAAIAIGAVLPDLPMFGFYAYYKLAGVSESVIWREKYFLESWQALFDSFNSIPLILIALVLSAWRGLTSLAMLLASMLIHCLLDLPVHHDDGHRHFFPFSDWRFASPLSYWDPAHFGNLVGAFETLAVIAGVVWLWRKPTGVGIKQNGSGGHGKSPLMIGRFSLIRWILIATSIAYCGFFVFVILSWSGME